MALAFHGKRKTLSEATICDRFGRSAGLENAWLGGHVFMVLAGPSLNTINRAKLHDPGIVTFGVNNVAALTRPTFWTYGDTTKKFHEAIWRDPGIIKFAPAAKFDDPIWSKRGEAFEPAGLTPRDCPGVFGIQRNNDFRPEQWLFEPSVNWGNGEEAAKQNGLPVVISTMIQAVRLCYLLGFRHVYLLGCDFEMAPGRVYAFDETKTEGACKSNMRSYEKIAVLFGLLKPHFDAAGFRVWNCNPNSKLSVFPHIPFDAAYAQARAGLPESIDTRGWYDLVKE